MQPSGHTRFYTTLTDATIDDITDRFKSAIDDEVDLFVLVCTHSKAGRIVGANPDKDIFKLMTSIESG